MIPVRQYCLQMLVIGIAIWLSACSREAVPPLVADNVVVNEAMPGRAMTVAYLSLTNNSRYAIRISSVTSPDFADIEMHETVLENGIARMRAVEELIIAPESTVKFEQGGLHLMLMQPNDNKDVSLNFYQDATLLLSVSTPVTPRGL